MRLVNAKTLELEDFFDDNLPQYAILSHRWQDAEISLQDMQNNSAVTKAGYKKLKLCCDQAIKHGFQYAWVDTCCIDKTSSAELTEAINSMYRWYQNASICYAFLFDVEGMDVSEDSDFGKSSWWSRGWTLQELLAPAIVEFYNSTWELMGTKEELRDTISTITGITVSMLRSQDPEKYSVAQRMSWAAKRTTTRVEDIAYSLLGIFGVNMPMLYGEGERAFIRLQEEIMKHSDDHSIFAWTSPGSGSRGLLAKSPAAFKDSSNTIQTSHKTNRSPYSTTNMGLSIELLTIPWAMEIFTAALDCQDASRLHKRKGIFLRHLRDTNQYARVPVENEDIIEIVFDKLKPYAYKKIYVRHKAWQLDPEPDTMYGFWLRNIPTKVKTTSGWGATHELFDVTSWNTWNAEDRTITIPTGKQGTAGILWYSSSDGYSALKLGFDEMFRPVCLFGGGLWGPSSKFLFPDSHDHEPLEKKLRPDWMNNSKNDPWLVVGDRLHGITKQIYNTFISMSLEEVEGGQKRWVVDIERATKSKHQDLNHYRHIGILCDGCEQVSDQAIRPVLFNSVSDKCTGSLWSTLHM
jgi:hypothetical protein